MHGCRDRQRLVAQRRVIVCEVKGETGQEQVVPTEGKPDRISNASRFIRKKSVARTKRNPTRKSGPSTRQKTIREVDGQLCMGLHETQCWQDHFEAVLNIRSSFIESATQAVHQHEVRDEINDRK